MDLSRITVGFDGKRASTNNTGLGNYSRYVVDVLSESGEMNLRLYTPRPSAAGERIQPLLRRANVELVGPTRHRLPDLWRMYGGLTEQLKTDKADLYHGLSNELPLDIAKAGIPSVVTIHDAIFHRCPENYHLIDRKIYDLKWRNSIAAATRVIAISECTRRDIMELYGADPDKIDVVYQGCDPIFKPVDAGRIAAVREEFNLPERFIVSVGTLEPRKNQMLILKALGALPAEVKLVLIGRGRQSYDENLMAEAKRIGLAYRVIQIDSLPFDKLPAVYGAATVSAYTSRYEGFGLPVIEALSVGTPVIAAKGSCLEEAGGKGALYVDPDNVKGFAEAANALLASDGLRRQLVAEGQAHVARFSRDNFHKGLIDSYEHAFEDFKRVERRKK